jgi:hypothetical protein
MAENIAFRKNINIRESNWKQSDIMIPVTYYNDGVVPTDHGRTKIEVLLMNILSFSPEMQQKSWSNICIGYINHTIGGITVEELVSHITT